METSRTWHFLRGLTVAFVMMLVATACSVGSKTTEYPAFPVTLPPTTDIAEEPEPPPTDTTTTSVPVAAEAPEVVTISPEDDASRIVDEAPQGTTFEFLPGIHRRFSVDPKDGTTFVGLEGAVLSGAILLGDATETANGWRFDGIEFTGVDHGKCIDGYDGCGLSQDLFFDDVMMWQVTDAADLDVVQKVNIIEYACPLLPARPTRC